MSSSSDSLSDVKSVPAGTLLKLESLRFFVGLCLLWIYCCIFCSSTSCDDGGRLYRFNVPAGDTAIMCWESSCELGVSL